MKSWQHQLRLDTNAVTREYGPFCTAQERETLVQPS